MGIPACLEELEEHAKYNLPKQVRDFVSAGANQEQTLRDSREAFKRIRLCPRLLIDVSRRDLSTTILGEKISFPVAIAPSSYQCDAHPDGEVATVRAASSMKTAMVLSSHSNKSLEEVAAAASPSCPLWCQFQFFTDEAIGSNLIRRAERAGYKALVVTLDTPLVGLRLADIRNNYTVEGRLPNLELERENQTAGEQVSGDVRYGSAIPSTSKTWEDVARLKKTTSLKVILKGIVTGHDAKLAVDHGADGIVVSNHGGRQLDGVPATIDALPEVVEAVRGSNAEVYLDGGIRQGTDVLKALALGARAVFIGRPVQWGLAYKGEEGVRLMLEMLKNEFSLAMALSGCTDAKKIPRSLVRCPTVDASKL